MTLAAASTLVYGAKFAIKWLKHTYTVSWQLKVCPFPTLAARASTSLTKSPKYSLPWSTSVRTLLSDGTQTLSREVKTTFLTSKTWHKSLGESVTPLAKRSLCLARTRSKKQVTSIWLAKSILSCLSKTTPIKVMYSSSTATWRRFRTQKVFSIRLAWATSATKKFLKATVSGDVRLAIRPLPVSVQSIC